MHTHTLLYYSFIEWLVATYVHITLISTLYCVNRLADVQGRND